MNKNHRTKLQRRHAMGEDCEKEHEGKLRPKLKLSPEDQLLLDAVRYLESGDVWCQGTLWQKHLLADKNKVCALGSIGASVPGPAQARLALGLVNNTKGWPGVALKACSQLNKYVCHITNGRFRDAPTWNDHPGRTKQEVIDTIRGAAILMLPDSNIK